MKPSLKHESDLRFMFQCFYKSLHCAKLSKSGGADGIAARALLPTTVKVKAKPGSTILSESHSEKSVK